MQRSWDFCWEDFFSARDMKWVEKRTEKQRTTHTWTTTHYRTQRRNQVLLVPPAAPAAHTRYLSSPASCPGFPQNKAHVTSMQPWQWVWPPFIEYSVLLLIVMRCKITPPFIEQSHTIRFVRISEDCFPTSFDFCILW